MTLEAHEDYGKTAEAQMEILEESEDLRRFWLGILDKYGKPLLHKP